MGGVRPGAAGGQGRGRLSCVERPRLNPREHRRVCPARWAHQTSFGSLNICLILSNLCLVSILYNYINWHEKSKSNSKRFKIESRRSTPGTLSGKVMAVPGTGRGGRTSTSPPARGQLDTPSSFWALEMSGYFWLGSDSPHAAGHPCVSQHLSWLLRQFQNRNRGI